MGFMTEFKKFALKGNMMDLAVGVIIGGAFNSIITSLVNDVFMPVISLFTGKIDFTNLFIALDGGAYKTLEEAQTAGASVLAYGSFITALINFIILAFVVFLIVRALNKMEKTAGQRRSSGCSDHQEVSLLPVRYSAGRDPLPALYF